jgi:deoxyribonuclease V
MKTDWPTNTQEARAIQEKLRERVVLHDDFGPIERVAGVDVGFKDNGKITRAAVVVLAFPTLEPLEQVIAEQPTRFPYVPGLLSFRELPAVLEALGKLKQAPDLLICDGQGIAHPRRLGIAAHLGVVTDIPSIGVAKSRLIGTHGPVPEEKGGWTPLMDKDEVIGAVLRTRKNVKPVFVSPGHRIGLESAIRLVLACTPRYRLPETTRLADRIASRRGMK